MGLIGYIDVARISDADLAFLRQDAQRLLAALRAARKSGAAADVQIAEAEFRSALALYLEARKYRMTA